MAGTFIWAVWAASSSQRGQGLPPAPKAWPLRETLSLYCCTPSSPLCAGRGRWGQGDIKGLSQCRQREGPSDPPATAHAMGSLPHISLVIPCPISKVAPTSAGKAPSYPMACPLLSAQSVLNLWQGCSLVASLALCHRATPVLALHGLQLCLEALQPPILPILRWLQVVAHGAIGLVCRRGCRCQAQLRLLQDSGQKELPRGQWAIRTQGSKSRWPQQACRGILTLELGVDETLLRSTSLKAPSDWSDI